MSRRTLRVLSIDGGGNRAYMANYFLKKILLQWGVAQTDLWKNFDVICGTSAGGILALAYAYGLTPDNLDSFFLNDGKWVFTIRSASDVILGSINASIPSNRPNTPQKLAIIANNDQFYRSVDPASNYGSGFLKQRMDSIFGTNTLQNLKTNVIIPSFRYSAQTPVLFSNLNYAEFIGQSEKISNVALSTSAANIYLPAITLDGSQYVDGGIFQNNPTEFGLTLAKMIKPTADRYCVLSLSNGLGPIGFENEIPADSDIPPVTDNSVETIVKLFNTSLTGGQEAIARNLFLESQYTLDKLYYYRFNPQLDLSLDTELDNSTSTFYTYLANTADAYFNDDIDNISNFIGHLSL